MIYGIQRAEQFSPQSVEKDRAILEDVVGRLHGIIIPEQQLCEKDLSGAGNVFLNMGRLPATTAFLKQREDEGALVLNSGYGVEMCQRSRLDALMREKHIPMPKNEDSTMSRNAAISARNADGWWIKRGDAAAQRKEDVQFCQDDEALAKAKASFAERGITDIVVQSHVCGDLLKFYGVEGTSFFRYYYPGDDGESKFGDEQVNGRPHHYFFQKEHLRSTVEMLSRLVRTPIYGGDAIITPEGEFKIIDFNDWPSFSRCREEAAQAITQLVRYNM